MSGAAYHPFVGATCICCGRSDEHNSPDKIEWLRVNYEDGLGVCAHCPEACADFDDHFAAGPLETTVTTEEPRRLAS